MDSKKIIDKVLAVKILHYMEEKRMNHLQARKFIEYLKIDGGTQVKKEAFPYVARIIEFLYSPDDYGRNGKISEVQERLNRWYENNRPLCAWHELHARRNGKSDLQNKKQEEMKTGAGDWLYSNTANTREDIIAQYRNRQSLIYWKTEHFAIRCTWEQLFDYMEEYNNKGVAQFFKINIKYNPQVNKSVCMLQEWKSSKKKIEFFKACPYNEE